MELLNAVAKLERDDEAAVALKYEIYNAVVLMLYPITPHICFKLYGMLGNTQDIDKDARWPVADPDALKAEDMLIVVQVNGRLRSRITVSPETSEEEIKDCALKDEAVVPHLEGKTIRKVIYVKGRLVNVVAA